MYTTVVFILLCIVASYIVVFSVKKPVPIAGIQRVCVDQLTLAPRKHQPTTTSAFDVTYEDQITLQFKTIASRTTCFTPKFDLKAGEYEVATSPFGGLFAQKIFRVTVL